MNVNEIISSAATSFSNYIKSGGKIVSSRIRSERLDICHKCDRLTPGIQVCKECLCFMKIKSMLPDSKCPLEKWGKAEELEPERNKDNPIPFECGNCK